MADTDQTEALRARVAAAAEQGEPLSIVGGGSKRFYGAPVQGSALDVSGHRGIISYEPTELVLTARAGTPITEIEDALDEAEDAEDIRRKGELLKIALSRLEKGQREVTVQDFFSAEQETVTLQLDPSLTPEQNMKECFEKYKKLKRRRDTLRKRLRHTKNRLRAARELQTRAANAENRKKLEALKHKAREVGATFPEDRPTPQQQESKGGPRKFISKDNYDILVARNENQNRELTFTIARGNDYWMHVMGHPGPHVIIRKPKDGDVPRSTMLDAAHLAIYYSDLGATDFAEVVYSLRKYVKQIKGGGPGRVGYSNASTLQVRVSRARLKRLLDSRPDSRGG